MIPELAKNINASSQADERETFKDLFYFNGFLGKPCLPDCRD